MNTVPLRRVAVVVSGQSPPNEVVTDLADGLPFIQGNAEFTERHPIPRLQCEDAPKRARPGDLLLSVRAPVGAMNWARTHLGIGRGVAALRPRPGWDSRYVAYGLIATLEHLRSAAAGSTFEAVTADTLNAHQLPSLPLKEQQRIADFLDDRVTRIDQIITARRQQIDRLAEAGIRASYEAVSGVGVEHRRPSGLDWLGDVPAHWGVLPVGMEFQVDLGKMLDEKRQTGTSTIRYLRNTNVQWDRVDTADLKEMDVAPEERDRYCVRAGDLLICEGGQPGRAAIWTGDIRPLAYQKALHRARSRGRSHPGWLLECLRVAVHMNVFNIGGGQTTIGHLTNEQLRAQRFPFPPRAEQERLLGGLHAQRERILGARHDMAISIDRLSEYKQSLITAAVSGELDVSTAASGIRG